MGLKICYVARHDAGGNQDENSIAYSLRTLGHTVECISEDRKGRVRNLNPAMTAEFDFILIHKCSELRLLKQCKPPKVFWDFDLVDATNAGGEDMRVRWMIRVQEMEQRTALSQLGFCTDGDWVAQDRSGKLVHLMQGADPRIEWFEGEEMPFVICTARSDKVGKRRESFMEFMTANVPNFMQYPRDVHGDSLHQLIARSMICVAPDWPVTDRYFSNRLALTCGYGGFILHRDSVLARSMYQPVDEFIPYDDQEHLAELVEMLSHPSFKSRRQNTRRAAFERTKREHTYLHRCEKLIDVVRERLL